MAQQKLAGLNFSSVIRSFELALFIPRAFHHRLSDSITEAKMFVTVRQSSRLQNCYLCKSTRSQFLPSLFKLQLKQVFIFPVDQQ